MKRENFYRRDPAAALQGMSSMSLEERGVYNTVIDLLYLTWRPVENDRRYIANHCGCAVQKLNPILARLIAMGKLIAFEEEGREYISNPRFEDERASVKGVKTTRGRREVGEKSAGVREKSASVGKNLPICSENDEQKPALTALEKSRVEKTDANASSVAEEPGDGAGYPELFELAWKAYPHVKGRSSKPKSLSAWERLKAPIRKALPAACARYVAEKCQPQSGASGMHLWLRDAKFEDWLSEPGPGISTGPAFTGPATLRESVVVLKGDAWTASWLDACGWDDENQALVPRTNFAAAKLRSEIGSLLHGLEIRIEERAA